MGENFGKTAKDAGALFFTVEKRFFGNGLDYPFLVIDSIYRQITINLNEKIYTPTILNQQKISDSDDENFGHLLDNF